MYAFVTVLIILASIFLILIVLVQNSKGGGLASNFASSNQVMGVRKTTDFLEKATWTLAGFILVLSFVAVMVLPKNQIGTGSVIDEQVKSMLPAPDEMPGFQVPMVTDEPAPATDGSEDAE